MRLPGLIVYFILIACLSPAMAGPSLRLSGPAIAESLPLLVMTQAERPWHQDFDVEFIPWHSPDMLRAMVAGGQVDAALITTAAAHILRSKGVNCRVAILHEAPVWVVSTMPGPDTLDSLEGTLLFPFGPGEMPELFYRATIKGKPSQVATRHTGSPLEAVNLLLAGKAEHALLCEPTASIAVSRSRAMKNRGVPELVKRVDMRKAWLDAFPGHRLAASSITFFRTKAEDKALMHGFAKAHEQAGEWVKSNPEKALAIARKQFPALAKQMEDGAIGNFRPCVQTGAQAKEDALFFLERIGQISPAAIGGTVPGDDLFEVVE